MVLSRKQTKFVDSFWDENDEQLDVVIDFREELTDVGKEFYKKQIDFLQTSRANAKCWWWCLKMETYCISIPFTLRMNSILICQIHKKRCVLPF